MTPEQLAQDLKRLADKLAEAMGADDPTVLAYRLVLYRFAPLQVSKIGVM